MADDDSDSSRRYQRSSSPSSVTSVSDKISRRSRSRSHSNRRKQRGRPYRSKRTERQHAIQFPSLDLPLLDFEAFEAQYVILPSKQASQDFTTERLRSFYGAYERSWENKQKELFFDQHREEQWIQDKYNPGKKLLFQEENSSLAKSKFQDFVKAYNSGAYNSINLTISEAQLLELCELNDQFYSEDQDMPFWEFYLKDNINIQASPFFGSEPNIHSLFIKAVPMELSRFDIVQELQKLPGYISLTLSEPSKLQNFSRMGWIEFDSEANANKILKEEQILVKGQTIYVQKQQDRKYEILYIRKPIRIFRSVDQNKLLKDYTVQRDLIKTLDREKGLNGNPLLEGSSKDRDDPSLNRQLDIQTIYLRKVHSYCYWSGGEFSDLRLMVSKAGYHFLRLEGRRSSTLKWQDIVFTIAEKRVDDSSRDKQISDIVDEEIVVKSVSMRSKSGIQADRGAYPCGYCTKNFQGDNYLIKHISNKHPTIYEEEKLRLTPEVIDKQMANCYRRERQSKAFIQRSIYQEGSIDEKELFNSKYCIPINFIPRLQQRAYKDLDSIAQEKTQPAILTKLKETTINYNDI